MSKNITINEGNIAKVFTGVKKITTNKSGSSGSVDWVPEDEAINYVDLDELDVDENGTYIATQEGCQAFSKVTVNVEPDLTTKGIEANGTYNASDDGADGYDSVVVDVHPNCGAITLTRNGTYHSSSDQLDGYSEVKVNVAGSGGSVVTGTAVEGIAVSNLNAGQTVHVYSEGGGVGEGTVAILDGGSSGIMYDGQVFWQSQYAIRKKSSAYIQESGHYEQVEFQSGYSQLDGPFALLIKPGNTGTKIITLDNFEGIDTSADIDTSYYWSNNNGNLLVTNTGLYDRGLRKLMSYPPAVYHPSSWGNRTPIDTGRAWGGTGGDGVKVWQTIQAIGTWQEIVSYELIIDPAEHYFLDEGYTSRRKFFVTKPIGGSEIDIYTISPTGSQSLLLHIPKKYCQISKMSPSGSHLIVVGYDSNPDESIVAYRLNDDGSYQQLRWPVNIITNIPNPSDEGFFIGSVYYPYGATGSLGNYIAGTGSKSAKGQLGIASASVAAGSRTSAIVLFT